MKGRTFATIHLLALLSVVRSTDALSDEARLAKHLISVNDKAARVTRPVYNTSEAVRVRLGVSAVDLQEVNEDTGVVQLQVWLSVEWRDQRSGWEPRDFNGVTLMYLPARYIWTPDITLYNSHDPDMQMAKDTDVTVSYTGAVFWAPRAVVRTRCFEDGSFYQCNYKFGSWVYDGFKLDLDFYGDAAMDMSSYVTSPHYDVSHNTAVRNTQYYDCCVEPYLDLTYTLRITKRNTGWW